MILNKFLRPRLYAPAGDEGSTVDRGDSFTPTDDDESSAAQQPGEAAAAAKILAKAEREAEKKAGKADAGKADAGKADDESDEGDEGDEGKEDGKGKERKGKGVIPLQRHEAVLARERERREQAERELKQFQGGDRVARVNAELDKMDERLGALEKEHTQLLTDGEHLKAAEKMREIRTLERERNTRESDMRIAEATSRATETARFEITRERLENAYPTLNPDHEDFDEDKTETVVDLMQAYQLKGMTPTDAMQRAVRKVMGVEGSRQAAATTVKPRVDAEDVEEEAEKEASRMKTERNKASIDKALEAAKKQAPSTDKTGLDSDKAGKTKTGKDVMKMTQAEFSKLDEAERARLRGDTMDA